MAAGDIYQCTVDFLWDNQVGVNIFNFVQIGSDGSGDPRIGVAEVWDSNFFTPYVNTLSNAVAIGDKRIRRLFPTQTQTFVSNIGVPGAVVGVPLPTNQVAVLRLYGTRSGRKGIGNMRLPGVDNVFVDEGRVNSSYAGIAEILGNAFEQDWTTAATAWTFRSCVLGTDDVARQVQITRMTSRIKQLRSRTIGQGT